MDYLKKRRERPNKRNSIQEPLTPDVRAIKKGVSGDDGEVIIVRVSDGGLTDALNTDFEITARHPRR